ncbi:MAG: flavin reductase family protein [Acidobacteria bacterium]|nr:flavin reductase family protein [Acidobacteriota bacterium]
MPVSNEEFRAALGRFASGVTVVTSKGEDGGLHGITVSAFSSLSLNPPLILVCIDNRSSLIEHLRDGKFFAVNILSEDQEFHSRRFASKEPKRFDGIGYQEGATGAPALDNALAVLECRVVNTYAGGDHTIVVGEVEATNLSDAKPLLYFRGGYNQLA